ncbi:MAG: hypothetical protein ABL883_08825 [Terricaulis sp.]
MGEGRRYVKANTPATRLLLAFLRFFGVVLLYALTAFFLAIAVGAALSEGWGANKERLLLWSLLFLAAALLTAFVAGLLWIGPGADFLLSQLSGKPDSRAGRCLRFVGGILCIA